MNGRDERGKRDGPGTISSTSWPLAAYARTAPLALVVGTALCLVALVTNPVPDPSFPWFSVPAEYRLSLTQPRIEHWPVSYTVGVWLWVGFVPGLFVLGHRRWSGRWGLGRRAWLLGLPAGTMLALTTYCRFVWPKPEPATWNAPAYSFVCWAYCSTYDPLWSTVAYATAALGLVAFALLARRSSLAVAAEATPGCGKLRGVTILTVEVFGECDGGQLWYRDEISVMRQPRLWRSASAA